MLTLLAAGLLAHTTPASAQSVPPCPADDELVETAGPEGYLRAGSALGLTAKRTEADAAVGAVEVSITTGPNRTTTEVLPFTTNRLRLIRSLPAGAKTVTVRFRWLQNAGTTSACVGEDAYVDVPIIPRRAKPGDPDVVRLPSRLTVRYGKRGRGGSGRWRLTPRCDVFGCRTQVRSSAGLRGTLVPASGGVYVMRTQERIGYCQVTYADGRVERFRFVLHQRFRLRPSAIRNGVATRLNGIRTGVYRLPTDELGVCSGRRGEREHVRARR